MDTQFARKRLTAHPIGFLLLGAGFLKIVWVWLMKSRFNLERRTGEYTRVVAEAVDVYEFDRFTGRSDERDLVRRWLTCIPFYRNTDKGDWIASFRDWVSGDHTRYFRTNPTATYYSANDVQPFKSVTSATNSKLVTEIAVVEGQTPSVVGDALINHSNTLNLGSLLLNDYIHSAAGYMLRRETAACGKLPVGASVLTKGYSLPHAAVIHVNDSRIGAEATTNAIADALVLAERAQLSTVVVDAAPTGFFGRLGARSTAPVAAGIAKFAAARSGEGLSMAHVATVCEMTSAGNAGNSSIVSKGDTPAAVAASYAAWVRENAFPDAVAAVAAGEPIPFPPPFPDMGELEAWLGESLTAAEAAKATSRRSEAPTPLPPTRAPHRGAEAPSASSSWWPFGSRSAPAQPAAKPDSPALTAALRRPMRIVFCARSASEADSFVSELRSAIAA